MAENRQDNEGYRLFREALQAGTIKAGMIVTQNELCDLLGLSLSPLRETLVLLEEFGLVEIKPRTGIRIVYPEVAFIRENFQFRSMIEMHALTTFGDQVSADWLASMRAGHEECMAELAGDTPFEPAQSRILTLDRKLHRDIVSLLDNQAILATHARLQDNLSMARRVHQRSVFRGQLISTVGEHMRIIDSLEQRDIAGAVANLEAHFRASTHRTFAV
ncbi:GntR family transcriptional regulator [Devosia sp.]|uniref:GntR family transcriptional regulator n=1 Tax=Devosia sp. TaxID=1871048 RepID=UPI003BA928C0